MIDEKRTWYAEHGFELTMSLEDAQSCSHPGPCDDDVAFVTQKLSSQLDTIDPNDIREELKGYGAWDDDELSDDDENRLRIVWIFAGNIADTEEN